MQFIFKAAIAVIAVCTAMPSFSQERINRNFRDLASEARGSRVQSNFVIIVPVEDGDTIKQQEEALRSFYKLASNSCAMVIETIAETCDVTNVTTNVNARDRGTNGSQLTVNGQITMQVKFKAGVSQTTP